MLTYTISEDDGQIEDIGTAALMEMSMELDQDIARLKVQLDLINAELGRRDDAEEEDNPPDPEPDEDYPYGDEDDDRSEFADPGGTSALRAATKDNPRNLPCPTCGEPNRLTPKDKALGYQCDTCADQLERGGY